MSPSIIFYDLASTEGPQAWSINPLKSRILLNYKQIPYTTVWVALKDVQTKLKPLGFTPHAEGKQFSVPAVELPDGEKIQDSWKIVQAIEKLHPQPSVHLDSAYVPISEKAAETCFSTLAAVLGVTIFRKHFDQEDRDFFVKERLAPRGVSSIDQIAKPVDDEGVWETLTGALEPVIDALKEQTAGPFFMGKEFSYADVYIASLFFFVKRVDEQFLERLLAQDEVLKTFFLGCQPYLKKVD